MPEYKINHTHHTSSNPQAAVDFYVKNLGAKLVKELALAGNNKAWDVDLGGLLVRVSAVTGADEALINKQSAVVAVRPQYGLHHIALSVDNLDAALKDLKAKGVEFVLEPPPAGTGNGVAFIKCPDSVYIELIGPRLG